ncbi:MAG: hypothetical protein V1740_06990 [Candidatus Woesearchaeota archaeon]
MPLEDLTEPEINCVSDAYKHFNRVHWEFRRAHRRKHYSRRNELLPQLESASYAIFEQRALARKAANSQSLELSEDEIDAIRRDSAALYNKKVGYILYRSNTKLRSVAADVLWRNPHYPFFHKPVMFSRDLKNIFWDNPKVRPYSKTVGIVGLAAVVVGGYFATPVVRNHLLERRIDNIEAELGELEFFVQNNDPVRARELCNRLMERLDGQVNPRLSPYKENVWSYDGFLRGKNEKPQSIKKTPKYSIPR